MEENLLFLARAAPASNPEWVGLVAATIIVRLALGH